jgi:dCTP deaminase
MLLSQHSLKQALHIGHIIKSENFPDQIVELKNQKAASLDLTVGSIFCPQGDKLFKASDMEELRLNKHTLAPGETLLIEVNEPFNMPTDKAGIIFAPNHLTKKGIIMTNPGHIDPGFEGKITVCLVNMGKDYVPFKQHDVICRLLVLKLDLDGPSCNIVGKGADVDQLNSLHTDFAAVTSRMTKALSKHLYFHAPVIIGILTIWMTATSYLLPKIGADSIEVKKAEYITNEMLNPLEEKIVSSIDEKLQIFQRKVDELNTKVNTLCKDSLECK